MAKLRILDPIGDVRTGRKSLAPRGRELEGLRLGILSNGKANADIVLDRAAKFLEERFGLVRTVSRRKPNTARPAEFMDEFAVQCDVAVVGVGD